MHPRRRFVPTSFLLRYGAIVYLLASCSPSSGEPPEVSRGGANSGTGGSGTSNGGSTSATFGGGNFGGAVGSGGALTGAGGAKGGTTGLGSGGAVSAKGGTTSTSSGGTTATTSGGAATVGSGGATTTACAYDGATNTDSKIFSGGFGKSTDGKWTGYAYTYSFGSTATTIKPPKGTMSCFMGAKLCAKGSVAKADEDGAGIGWSIGQTMGGGTPTAVAITTPVNFKVAGAGGGMRVALVNDTTEYCYTLTTADADKARSATGLDVPLASFKTKCWGTEGTAFTGSATAIQVAVPGSATAGPTAFDICIIDIAPGI